MRSLRSPRPKPSWKRVICFVTGHPIDLKRTKTLGLPRMCCKRCGYQPDVIIKANGDPTWN